MGKKLTITALMTLLVTLVLVSGCVKKTQKTEVESLIQECKNACKEALAKGIDLSNGPCLLDPMSNPSWVCDIAHKPRKAIDNLKENQCKAWHNKTATHFIELTPNCELIRVY